MWDNWDLNLALRLHPAVTSLESRVAGQGRLENRYLLPAEGAGVKVEGWSPSSPLPLVLLSQSVPASGCPHALVVFSDPAAVSFLIHGFCL